MKTVLKKYSGVRIRIIVATDYFTEDDQWKNLTILWNHYNSTEFEGVLIRTLVYNYA